MNVRRFTARTSRDALVLVRQALGEDAVVLSTKPSAGGVEVLAMAPEGMKQIERMAAQTPAHSAPASAPARSAQSRAAGHAEAQNSRLSERDDDHDEDSAPLAMSTVSFQDYVRDRMLRRRSAGMNAAAAAPVREEPKMLLAVSDDSERDEVLAYSRPQANGRTPAHAQAQAHTPAHAPAHSQPHMQAHSPAPMHVQSNALSNAYAADHSMAHETAPSTVAQRAAAASRAPLTARTPSHAPAHAQPQPAAASNAAAPFERGSVLEQRMSAPASQAQMRETQPVRGDAYRTNAHIDIPLLADSNATQASNVARRDQEDMMSELRSMKGLIEERFGALAFMEKLNRQPAQARLTQKLLDCGFSPALIRKIGDSLPMDVTDESMWAAGVLERNLATSEHEAPLEDQGGVYALVGATGVGKTTTTAKIAAAFAAKYGAANLGLITLDAYRIGAHEQLRAYGRILGVPVHTAHDRASLEDLLDLLSAKKMVLIDTAGMAQRDARTRELLDMLSHRSIRKLLVVNAASQGETIEDVAIAYQATTCAGVVLSKLDEAVKLAPALDAMIRMKLKVIGVANGQRVPEDWHRLSANALVHRALRAGGSSAYKLDASDVSLIFTAPLQAAGRQGARPVHA